MKRFAVAVLAVLAPLALNVLALTPPAFGQRALPPRTFAPGVLTTIPPAPQAEELFSGPVALAELPIATAGLDYQPQLSSVSTTALARSKEVVLRRTVWNLEFSFKPMRMITVDVPQASGRMQRERIWYMVYRVRNLGGHLKPTGLVDAALDGGEDPNQKVVDLVTLPVPEPKDLYDKFKAPTDEVEVIGRTTKELRFFPHFVLHSSEYQKEYLDRIIPAALGPIREREFPGRPNQKIYNSLTISEAAIPISDEAHDHSVWGVVTWSNIDPKIDYFVVYVQGLTNAYKFEDPPGAFKAGDAPGTGRKIFKKTLQLNFWRPGDTVDPNEEEIHFGCRLDPDADDQARILKEYGIEKPVDYIWTYR